MALQKKTLSARAPMMMPTEDEIAKKEREMNFINEGFVSIPEISPAAPLKKTSNAAADSSEINFENAREDVFKVFNVRLTEPMFVKLKYIAQRQKRSTNSICTELIGRFIEENL